MDIYTPAYIFHTCIHMSASPTAYVWYRACSELN